MGRGRERRGEEGSRGEGKGKFVPTNVRDALTPLFVSAATFLMYGAGGGEYV